MSWSVYFNPRSYKRSDFQCLVFLCLINLFQSTLLQEERLPVFGILVSNKFISIHAPTRGATQWLKIGVRERQNFNPRSYKRSDATRSNCNIFYLDFNPRSYKRSDDIIVFKFILSVISIHAPTRGATRAAWHNTATTCNFNPRSYKRSDI